MTPVELAFQFTALTEAMDDGKNEVHALLARKEEEIRRMDAEVEEARARVRVLSSRRARVALAAAELPGRRQAEMARLCHVSTVLICRLARRAREEAQ